MPSLHSNDLVASMKAILSQLPDGWSEISLFARPFVDRTLRRQLGPEHLLWGKSPRALARREGSDDVLFQLSDGQVALVHLSWQKEKSADWPHVTVFSTISEFVDNLAQEAVSEVSNRPKICSECGSNWSANEVSADCAICGGFALYRTCPICGGRCGAIWERAVLDSNDQHEPVFVGACLADK